MRTVHLIVYSYLIVSLKRGVENKHMTKLKDSGSFPISARDVVYSFVLTASMENRFSDQLLCRVTRQVLPERLMQIAPPTDRAQVTYVWIDGTGEFLRTKTRTLQFIPKHPDEVPKWNYCGYGTFQATGNVAEMILYPRALYPDPFLTGNNKLVLCDTYTFDGTPLKSNNRHACEEVMKKVTDQHPWFSIEQKYTLMNGTDWRPLGWLERGYPQLQGLSYCGIGANKVFGRSIEEGHYRACLYAGINISESNADVSPAQWKFRIGLCEGINVGDEVWMARYLLHRVAEKYHVMVTFDPDWMAGGRKSGSVCCTFSSERMRAENGTGEIERAMDKLLSEEYTRSITNCNMRIREEYEHKLSNRKGTSSMLDPSTDDDSASTFTSRTVIKKEKYLEENRLAPNSDPYRIAEVIARTICFDKKELYTFEHHI